MQHFLFIIIKCVDIGQGAYQCYSNVFSKPVCANEYDWLKFIEWFHTIKDDDGKLL